MDLVDQDDAVSPQGGEEAPLIPPKDYPEASLRLRDFVDIRFMTAVLTQVTISSMLAAFETVCHALSSCRSELPLCLTLHISDSTAIHNGDIQMVLNKSWSHFLGNISTEFPQHPNEQIRS